MTLTDQDISNFVSALGSSSRYNFTDYSFKSLNRRLLKVLTDNDMDMPALIDGIKKDGDFLELVVREITVNTTELFRDPQVWQTLRYTILPKFIQADTIRIWHAGCSSGQEVYSMMILLNELKLLEKTEIFGSDINSEALGIARKGIYRYRFNLNYLDNFDKVVRENPRTKELCDVPYSKYFKIDKIRDSITVADFLVKKPKFIWHDLVNPESFYLERFDLILCRNVIIYFNFPLQNKVFSLFYENLSERGILVLGEHETILGPFSDRFTKFDHINIKK
ncbi:MAG: hypothetical protein JSV24_11005, partial [Bacteroidales bacterium]